MIGKIFQGWTVKAQIGEGAFGKIYRIERKDEFGHTYTAALKVIDVPKEQSEVTAFKNEGMTDDNVTVYFKGMVEKIVEEFVLMSKLKGNSNIVSYEDHAVEEKKDEFGWRIYIRMELLTPLLAYVKQNNGLSEQEIIKLGIDICKGLELCKKFNIIHRDIKPANMFISESGDFKLGDFGIARELERTSAGLTKVGTENYMAPEVFKGQEYNATVDIYSLGIVLYRFLNDNCFPFMPKDYNHSNLIEASRMRFSGQTMPAPVKASKELADIILKACAYMPSDRYALPGDMRRELEKLQVSDNAEIKIFKLDDSKKEKDRKTISLFPTHPPDDTANPPAEPPEEDNPEDNPEDNGGTIIINPPPIIDIDPGNDRGLPPNGGEDPPEDEEDKKLKKIIIILAGCLGVVCLVLAGIFLVKYRGNSEEQTTETTEKADTTKKTKTAKETEKPKKTKEPVEKIKTPDLKNMTKQEAKSKLSEYKLDVTYESSKYSDKVDKGLVLSQSPAAGKDVEIGSEVKVTLSKGAKPTPTPKPTKKPTPTPKPTPRPTPRPTPKPTPRPTATPKKSNDSGWTISKGKKKSDDSGWTISK